MKSSDSKHIRPFLKWAGGKFKLIDRIQSLFPPVANRYIEPFVGAGAVALNTTATTTIINDINAELINVWTMLRLQPDEVIHQCGYLFSGQYNNSEAYYQLRKEFNSHTSKDARQAALFIYLNKHGFNGLCRFNRKDEFNVPFGKYKTVNFDAEVLRNISKKMQGWVIANQDFRTIMSMAEPEDVYYLDPPYVSDEEVANGFTGYSAGGFTLKDQEDLADAAHDASERGATVLISNHNTEFTQELYISWGAAITTLEIQRNISCDGNNRKKAHELIAVFSPKHLDN